MKTLSTLDVVKDTRVNCYSVMTTVTIEEYIELVKTAYPNRGGIRGQREPLKTNTAIRIRARMVDDLKHGAVLPPVVVGLVLDEKTINLLDSISKQAFVELLNQIPHSDISIIDGIQRTTAMMELPDGLDRLMRVEFWIASHTNSLIYRMLVLNTGQVPWNLRRQVEVVFDSLINEIKSKVSNLELLSIDDGNRRSRAGKFQANQIIELFLVFGTRKEKINLEERLADEFTRLDLIEATSNDKFTDLFCEALQLLVNFDIAIDRYQPQSDDQRRFQNGRDLFSSQPAQVGFIAAIALEILGRPGAKERTGEEQAERLSALKANATECLNNINSILSGDLDQFLDFNTLNELLSAKKVGKVGEFEREFFVKAFSTLIEQKFKVESLTSCWRAY